MHNKTVLVLVALSLTFVLISLQHADVFWRGPASSTEELVRELTISPLQQQNALDELANYDEKKLARLLPYLADDRRLASTDVRFLNTSSTAFEKYYMTEAGRVDEVLIRYICWTTSKCDPVFDVRDLGKARRGAVRVLNGLAKQ